MSSPHSQAQYQVRFDWGIEGSDAVASDVDVIVLVDVLSFSTAVDIATTLGVEVVPSAPSDAHEIGILRGSPVAGRRGEGLSVSPASITKESVEGLSRIVLPSPNGSRIAAALFDHPALLVAGGLRNRTAVANWVLDQQGDKGGRFSVAVIAAGELRHDESTRFAVEDQLGAGAIIDALAEVGIDFCSPEAAAAGAAFTGLRNAIKHLVGASASGKELAELGFRDDIRLAAQLDASTTVPVLREFSFRA